MDFNVLNCLWFEFINPIVTIINLMFFLKLIYMYIYSENFTSTLKKIGDVTNLYLGNWNSETISELATTTLCNTCTFAL